MIDIITLPREVIERAISALERGYDVESYPNDRNTQQEASLNEIRAALAQQAEHGIIRNFDFIGFGLLKDVGLQAVISKAEDGKRGVFTIQSIDSLGSGVRYE